MPTPRDFELARAPEGTVDFDKRWHWKQVRNQ
jgi:hypothetical protein